MSLTDRFRMIPKYTVTSCVRVLAETEDYNHKLMNIPEAWKDTRGGGIKIAVLDTGCPKHIDISPAGHASMIDGYEFDGAGHSTHCAGAIAAIADNGIGVRGIAPDVEDHYVAVLDGEGTGSVDNIIRGIRYAVDVIGADIITMSLGIDATASRIPELEAACNYAVTHGTAVFAAAGNEAGRVGQPAQYDSVIAVAAVNSAKEHANFSNTGPEVDFACGGVDIYSTYLNNTYAKLSGSSMSTPALAAVGVLLLAKHKLAGEKLTPAELKEHIQRIAFDVGPGGYDEIFGWGIPVFGHNNTGLITPTPPAPTAPKETKKFLPTADCMYWKMWNKFIDEVAKGKADGDPVKALVSGLDALISETAKVNAIITKKL